MFAKMLTNSGPFKILLLTLFLFNGMLGVGQM
jgi:hypothetical protein